MIEIAAALSLTGAALAIGAIVRAADGPDSTAKTHQPDASPAVFKDVR